MVCTVVGFPLGAMTRLAKAEEARITVAEGADEADMVLDVGGLLSGDLAAVYDDILGVVGAARPVPVKVILETSMLTDEQKAIACLIAARTGAAYVGDLHRLRWRRCHTRGHRPDAAYGRGSPGASRYPARSATTATPRRCCTPVPTGSAPRPRSPSSAAGTPSRRVPNHGTWTPPAPGWPKIPMRPPPRNCRS